MKDLIERQAAIERYGDWYVEEGTEEGFIGDMKHFLEMLPSAEPEVKEWIPVEKRLPEKTGDYLVTVLMPTGPDISGVDIAIAPFSSDEYAWRGFGKAKGYGCAHHIVAWMPLPEPYQEDKDQ